MYERVSRTEIGPSNVWPYSGDLLRLLETLPDFGAYNAIHQPALLLFCGSAWPLFYRKLYRGPSLEEDIARRIETCRLVPQWVRHYETLRESPYREERQEAEAFFLPDGRNRWSRDPTPTRESLMRRAEREVRRRSIGEDLLIDLRSPCAIVLREAGWNAATYSVAIVTNPRLGDLGFAREMDPYACYQTIETFLGSQLAPPDLAPQRVGSDEEIALQKGFDAMSFRTAAPGAKKEHRAENRKRKRGL